MKGTWSDLVIRQSQPKLKTLTLAYRRPQDEGVDWQDTKLKNIGFMKLKTVHHTNIKHSTKTKVKFANKMLTNVNLKLQEPESKTDKIEILSRDTESGRFDSYRSVLNSSN